MEDMETKERKSLWGDRPNGYIVLTPGGRWIVVQTAEGRQSPESEEDRAAAFRSMLAYSGKYHTEGNKIIINVDIAWDEFMDRNPAGSVLQNRRRRVTALRDGLMPSRAASRAVSATTDAPVSTTKSMRRPPHDEMSRTGTASDALHYRHCRFARPSTSGSPISWE